MTRPTTLLLAFDGWCTVRIQTDPDPCDERRGASGYTLAFAGEPDFDRLLRLQPLDAPDRLRPGAPWKWGVVVREAEVLLDDGTRAAMPELVGAEVRLLDEPRLENRNWALTPPGKEPIVPFKLEFRKNGKRVLYREAPLMGDPDEPFWQKPLDILLEQAADGIYSDPALIATSTGIADPIEKFRRRQKYLAGAIGRQRDPVKRQCLESRKIEVDAALDKPDRRIFTHNSIERFFFEIRGTMETAPGALSALNPNVPWNINFWIGSWDCDLLGAFFSGKLKAPFLSP